MKVLFSGLILLFSVSVVAQRNSVVVGVAPVVKITVVDNFSYNISDKIFAGLDYAHTFFKNNAMLGVGVEYCRVLAEEAELSEKNSGFYNGTLILKTRRFGEAHFLLASAHTGLSVQAKEDVTFRVGAKLGARILQYEEGVRYDFRFGAANGSSTGGAEATEYNSYEVGVHPFIGVNSAMQWYFLRQVFLSFDLQLIFDPSRRSQLSLASQKLIDLNTVPSDMADKIEEERRYNGKIGSFSAFALKAGVGYSFH